MTDPAVHTERSGQSSAPAGAERSHTLVVLVNDRHGALDRIVGILRRRRANIRTLAIGRSEVPDIVRITVVMADSEVEVNHFMEQIRKVVEVRHIVNLSPEQTVARELMLIKVNSSTASNEIIELGHLFGAQVVDVASETITLEVSGNQEKVEKLVDLLQGYGIREIARTGSVAMERGL